MAFKIYNVFFGPKFCQKEFEDLLQPVVVKGGNLSETSTPWDLSIKGSYDEIQFDLTLNEWMGTEQIVFLFAWIRNLKNINKKVTVILPYRFELANILTKEEIARRLELACRDVTYVYGDNSHRVERRSRCSKYLLSVFGLIDQVGLKESDFNNLPDNVTFNAQSTKLLKNIHQVIPFSPLDISLDRKHIKYDLHFYDIIDNNFHSDYQTRRLFELRNDIQELLKTYACYSPFESKILSNVITQEAFINSLQHSFDKGLGHGTIEECYLVAFLANKWSDPEDKNFAPSFVEEKVEESLDFYRDKQQILKRIKRTIANKPESVIESRYAILGKYPFFANKSYLEYSFLDFGQGIHESLKATFENAVKEDELRLKSNLLSDDFWSAPVDAQILEYALLLDTSKDPLDKTIAHYEMVPRGLFFLVDMVRRYKGLLTIRSGYGKVIYDFSDKIYIERSGEKFLPKLTPVYRIRNAVKHSKAQIGYFPGTLISIVLPEKNTESNTTLKNKKRNESVIPSLRNESDQLTDYAYKLSNQDFQLTYFPTERFAATNYAYYSILILYYEIIEALKGNEEEIHVKVIYNRLFARVDQILNEHQDQNIILLFDFAGLKSGNALWIKILYLLINTPKVNEQTKAMIFNLPNYEDQLIRDLKENLVHIELSGKTHKVNIPDPFLYKPIPCIKFRIQDDESKHIDWIGLKHKEDAPLLSDLLLGQTQKFPISNFLDPENVTGNLGVEHEQFLQCSYSGFEDIKTIFFREQKARVAEFLKSFVESGPTQTGGNEIVFLSTNRKYQREYLSLYELLHDKYVARYFAKCLLNNYCEYVKRNFTIPHTPEDLSFSNLEEYKFTKIMAVTVSSQLLGVAIRDLIEEDDDYVFLRRNDLKKGGPGSAPELIMLSSYYSFDTEKPFTRVDEKDRVLVVNDVIATGNLVSKIIKQVEKIKKGRISAVFSVADTRIPDDKIEQPDLETPSIFFDYDNLEQRFFTLASHREGLIIRKYNGPYEGKGLKKRINPLLNTVVDLHVKHSETSKILLDDPAKLITDGLLSTRYLKIGHFQQNLTHNGYITDMKTLFGKQNGRDVIQLLKNKLDSMLTQLTSDEVNVRLVHLANQLHELKGHIRGADHLKIDYMIEEISQIEGISNPILPLKNAEYVPDFIFYPVFSGVEKLSHYQLSEIFHIHPDNIIGLQRFDTPKGWRFPFPAKRFNEMTRNRSILILDSGSLKGESLVQLIDNIGFLDVKDITVLSVICRIEDFNREFYSRLKSIKVKRLKSKADKENSSEDTFLEHVVPIKILFGINLHIPVYSSAISCPFCEEIDELKHDQDLYQKSLTEGARSYIERRIDELRPLNSSSDELANIDYLPTYRGSNGPPEVDTKAIFVIRNKLGMIDSYRFFPEYFDSFLDIEEIASKLIRSGKGQKITAVRNLDKNIKCTQEIELLLICLLHEPNLLELIENYLNGVVELLRTYLLYHYLYKKANESSEFYYQWSSFAQLKLCFLLAREEIYQLQNFEKILMANDEMSRLFLHYNFYKILYDAERYDPDTTKIDQLLRAFHDNYNDPKTEYSAVYNDINQEFPRLLFNKIPILNLKNYQNLDRPFDNLARFVYKGESKGRHFELIDRLNKLFLAVESRFPDVTWICEKARQVLDIIDRELKPSLEKIVEDPGIEKYFGNIFNIFSDQDGGVLFYVNRLEHCYQQIMHSEQEDIVEHIFILEDISGIADLLVNQVFKQTEEKDCFFRISKDYPIRINEVMTNFYQRNIDHFDPAMHADTQIGDEVEVACHKAIYESILDEIVGNASSRFGEDFVFEDFKWHVNDNQFELFLKQNRGFVFSSRVGKGGRTGIIEHFIKKFGGEFTDNADECIGEEPIENKESISNYWLRIKLPVYILEHGFTPEAEELSQSITFLDKKNEAQPNNYSKTQ